jgi:hypothetical protein
MKMSVLQKKKTVCHRLCMSDINITKYFLNYLIKSFCLKDNVEKYTNCDSFISSIGNDQYSLKTFCSQCFTEVDSSILACIYSCWCQSLSWRGHWDGSPWHGFINLVECCTMPCSDGLFKNCCLMLMLMIMMMMMMIMMVTTDRLVGDLLLSPEYDVLQLVNYFPCSTNGKGQLKYMLKILHLLKILVIVKLVNMNWLPPPRHLYLCE